MKLFFFLMLGILFEHPAAAAPAKQRQRPATTTQPNAGEADAEKPAVVDLDQRLTIAPFFDSPGTNISLIYDAKTAVAPNTDSQTPEPAAASAEKTIARSLDFSHKLIHTFGTSVTYGNLGWAFRYQPRYNKGYDPKKGKTEYFDIRSTYSLTNMIIDTYYQRYQGFYVLQYEEDGHKKQVRETDVIRPNLQINNFGVITTYVFKGETFAPRAAIDFTKKQTRMGHSPLVSLSYLNSYIRDDDRIIPESIGQDFGNYSDINDIKLHTLTVAGGYGITGVVRDFLFHAAGQLGAGGSKSRYDLGDSTHDKILYSVVMDLQLAAGYSSDQYFSGLNYIWHTTNTVIGDLRLMRGAYSATFTTGMRW